MQPGQFNPKGEDWIGRELAELRRELRELKAANVFGLTGITPKDGGTDFDGFVNVNGPMKVTGTLDLPAGIINNDALANPITGTVVNAGAVGFGMSASSLTQKLSATVTVPAGFTKAHVIAYADMTANNPTAANDYAYIWVKIAGASPLYTSQTNAPAGRVADCGSSFARVLTGLGASFDITVEAGSDLADWAPHPDFNVINLNAMVTFLR